jgi:serine/threonine protein kinase
LVNLTCGRNPWKRASLEDSTYQAYMKDRKFLQSILPLSDSLSRILDRIFEVEPAKRITLKELKEEIYVCDRFTFPVPAEHVAALPSPPPSPMHYEQFARSRDSDSTSSLSDEGSLVSDHSDDSIDSCHSLPEEYPEMVVERPQDESYAFQELQSAVILQNFSHATRYPNTAPHSPPHCYQYYTPKPTLPSFQYQQYCETTTYYDCHQLYSHSFPCYAIPYASVC